VKLSVFFSKTTDYKLQTTTRYVTFHHPFQVHTRHSVHFTSSSGVSIQETHRKEGGLNVHKPTTKPDQKNVPHDCAAEEALLLAPAPCGRKLAARAILYVGTRRALAFVLGKAAPAPAPAPVPVPVPVPEPVPEPEPEPFVPGSAAPAPFDLSSCDTPSLGVAGPSTFVAAADGLGHSLAEDSSGCVSTI
jgi:hypothetical protein